MSANERERERERVEQALTDLIGAIQQLPQAIERLLAPLYEELGEAVGELIASM